MRTFKVEGMSCGHCERAVTSAVRGIDPGASVEVDLAAGLVRTDSEAATDQLADALRLEGYPARLLAA